MSAAEFQEYFLSNRGQMFLRGMVVHGDVQLDLDGRFSRVCFGDVSFEGNVHIKNLETRLLHLGRSVVKGNLIIEGGSIHKLLCHQAQIHGRLECGELHIKRFLGSQAWIHRLRLDRCRSRVWNLGESRIDMCELGDLETLTLALGKARLGLLDLDSISVQQLSTSGATAERVHYPLKREMTYSNYHERPVGYPYISNMLVFCEEQRAQRPDPDQEPQYYDHWIRCSAGYLIMKGYEESLCDEDED